jgi:uncharacterized protein YndB with AHSA1/START domain
MAKVESTVTIARPVEDVFRFFLEPDKHAAKTDPNIESVVKGPEGPTVPGTTFHFRQRALGKTRATTTRFTSVEPNRRIEFEATLGPLRPKGALTFEQSGRGTKVTARLDPNPVGAFKLVSRLLARKGQSSWDERLARIKAALESNP